MPQGHELISNLDCKLTRRGQDNHFGCLTFAEFLLSTKTFHNRESEAEGLTGACESASDDILGLVCVIVGCGLDREEVGDVALTEEFDGLLWQVESFEVPGLLLVLAFLVLICRTLRLRYDRRVLLARLRPG